MKVLSPGLFTVREAKLWEWRPVTRCLALTRSFRNRFEFREPSALLGRVTETRTSSVVRSSPWLNLSSSVYP